MGVSLEDLRDIKMREMKNGKIKKVGKFEVQLFRFYLWFKKIIFDSFVFIFNNTLGILSFKMNYSEIEIPINHVDLLETLLKVHGHQILIDGIFNGDPHPGNILLLNNSNKLGLIDFGFHFKKNNIKIDFNKK